ncbi:MAG: GNAT family N-acetyltransferase [Geminicoccaceae bacterium]
MSEIGLIQRIEAAALWAWPPKETAHDNGWLLRAAGGHTRRANSAQTLVFASGAHMDRAIGRVEAWYAKRGLASCFQLTDRAAPAGLDQALEQRGYARLTPVSVLVCDLARIEPGTGPRIELDTRPTPQVMNAVCDPRWEAATRRARAELFARIRRPHVFAVLLEGIQPVAGGLCVLDRELAGVFTLRTAVPARGKGYGRSVVRRLAAWARGMGARQLYLQVEDDNAPARALVAPLGARAAYGYWYRELDVQAA